MTASTRDTAGRFTKATWSAICSECGAALHERLDGDLVCVLGRCDRRGHVVGNSGADVGVLDGAS